MNLHPRFVGRALPLALPLLALCGAALAQPRRPSPPAPTTIWYRVNDMTGADNRPWTRVSADTSLTLRSRTVAISLIGRSGASLRSGEGDAAVGMMLLCDSVGPSTRAILEFGAAGRQVMVQLACGNATPVGD